MNSSVLEQRFLKTYADRTYKHTTLVRHNGTLIAFAMNDHRRIYYTVLDLESQEQQVVDAKNWLTNPKELLFSNEITRVGFAIAGEKTLPLVRIGGEEVEEGTVQPHEIDRFLSSTARLTADAPFQVISDNQYVYVFRQAIAQNHPDMVFARDAQGQQVQDADGNPVPIVHETLLVDRFVLVGQELRMNREARYRRSRSKTRPLNSRDTLGASDMSNRPFFEPTQELDFIQHLKQGRFTVLLLPTQISDVKRWQIFAYNRELGQIDSFNVERSPEGLFNLRGSELSINGDNGERTGLRQMSFQVKERAIASALSALLYFQQESMPMPDGTEKPMKQNARVMLAVATRGLEEDQNHPAMITALDFGVSKTGQLTQVPKELDLSILKSGEADPNSLVQYIADLEAAIPNLIQQINQLRRSIAQANTDIEQRQHRTRSLNGRFWQLSNNSAAATARFYSEYEYRGSILTLNAGYRGNVENNRRIRSIRMSGALTVTVYKHDVNLPFDNPSETYQGDVPYIAQGKRCVHGSCSYIPNELTDSITGIEVQVSPDVQKEIEDVRNELRQTEAELADLHQLLMPLEQQLIDRQQQLSDTKMELRDIRKQLMGDQFVSMPLVHIDSTGMTVTGGILSFAQTIDNPQLFESATGKLALYFRGEQDEFFAAYYDTNAARAGYKSMESHVSFIARTTGSDLAKTAIAIHPGVDPDTCTVILQNPDLDVMETWQRVPRDADRFAAVLDGQATESMYLGRLGEMLSGQQDELTLSEPTRRNIASGSAVLLGGELIALRQSVLADTTTIPITKTAFEVDLPAGEPVYLIEYNYTAYAETTRQGYDLENGSLLIRAIADDTPGSVRDTTEDIRLAGMALSTRWVADPPGNAITFLAPQSDTENDERYLVGANAGDRWAIQGDGTLEAWIEPTALDSTAHIIEQHSPDSRYSLSLQPEVSQSAVELNHTGHSIWVSEGVELSNRSFTIELWVKANTENHFTSRRILAIGDRNHLALFFHPEYGFTFVMNQNLLSASPAHTDTEWHHWACTYDINTRRRVIYRDGLEVARDTADVELPEQRFQRLQSYSFIGAIDELRIWEQSRSQQDIFNLKDSRISGDEAGLLGCWSFENLTMRDRSPHERHGGVGDGNNRPRPRNVSSPIRYFPYAVVTGFGNKFVQSQQTFTSQAWNHFAAVYNQSYALQFDGEDDYLDCGNSISLNLGQEMTIELILQTDEAIAAQGLLSKGILNSSNSAKRAPYALYLTGDGGVGFAFQDDAGRIHQLRSPANSLPAGAVSRIAVTRKTISDTSSNGGADLNALGIGATIDSINLDQVTDLDNTSNQRDIDRAVRADYVSSKQRQRQLSQLDQDFQQPSQPAALPAQTNSPVQEWLDIKLYINGQVVDNRHMPAIQLASTDEPLEVGRAYGTWQTSVVSGTTAKYFKGAISEIRLWNEALSASALHGNLTGHESGLVAWWQFGESEGSMANDPIGRNEALINGPRWIVDPDPDGSTLVLYHNGIPIETTAIDPILPSQSNQFSLGQGYNGNLDEVRIWRTARTEENLLDNLFGRLKGERQVLMAYYTFDREHSDAEIRVRDHSLRGNQLVVSSEQSTDVSSRLRYAFSTAPICEDVAIVRNAMAGIQTRFQDRIHSRPVVAEYGDLQYNATGELVGSQKRCYSFIKHGQWYLLTGFKVGNLISEWVSQVQYDPQVMGYIEGAPPIPSENLTESAGNDFTAATSVEIVEAENVNYAISSDRESGFNTSLYFAAHIGADTSLTAVIAPLGIGYLQPLADVKFGARANGQWDTSQGWSSSETQGQGINNSRNTTVSLSGFWEDANSPQVQEAYEALGRRYLPANVGFAVVQSETADVFALRLEHNHALVAYRIRPNRDIPRDVNLIPFPMNPHYTKQGTLDGSIGYSQRGKILDPDYPNAIDLGEHSYFKPREAYALRNRIQREEQQLRSFYENFAPITTLSQASQGTLDVLRRGFGSGIRSTAETLADRVDLSNHTDPLIEGYAKRNIVNTYVWTAEGGFYAESTETATVKQETTGSSYSSGGSVGAGFHLSTNALGFDVGLEYGGSVGAQLTVTKTVTRDSDTSFGMNVFVNPPGNTRTSGKVDAYRFFTFSLEPAPQYHDHLFEQVVDPIWLAQSNHANAIALRQAKNSDKKPPCWRVFHRVTFVSRILPELPDATEAPMEAAIRAADIESNWLLIQRLDPHIRNYTQNFGVFAGAVREAIHRYLPKLQKYTDEIIEYLALYYGLEV